MSAEVTPVKPPFKPKLTRKQQHFVQELIDNPKISATEAADRAYDVSTRQTAEVIAYENLRKPQVVMALGEHLSLAESAIVGTVRDWKDSEKPREREISLDAAKYLHDKVVGKATQRIESTSKSVEIHINLNQGEDSPTDTPI